MGQFGFISSTRKRPILFPSPFSHRRQAADTVFLSSSSLSPFFIFKENSRPAEGAQLRRSLAVQRAPQGAAGPQKLFPGKAWAAGHILKLPRRQRGAWSGASGCNSGHLARRWKAPALIPNSESHVSTLTQMPSRSPPPPFIPQVGRLTPTVFILWGLCLALPFTRLG